MSILISNLACQLGLRPLQHLENTSGGFEDGQICLPLFVMGHLDDTQWVT